MSGIDYNIYQGVNKSFEYPYGQKKLDKDYNPFLDGPCFLSIAAMIMNKKANNGVAKQARQLARIATSDNINAGFNVEDVPIKFLSLQCSYEIESNNRTYNETIKKFTKEKLLPLVLKDGKKIEVSKAMRNMRNVNILAYCNGTAYSFVIENTLINEMEKLGYSEEEILKIQSQMCVFPFATFLIDGSEKSTYIGFRDINDNKVSKKEDEEYLENIKNSKIGEYLRKYSNNVYEYFVDGDGKHIGSLPKYAKDGKALPAIVSSVITNALENSIKNNKPNSKFTPISIKLLVKDIPDITKKAEEGQTKEDLLKELDEKLSYDKSKKMTSKQIEIFNNIDTICDKLIKLKDAYDSNDINEIKNALEEKMNISKELDDLILRLNLEKENRR